MSGPAFPRLLDRRGEPRPVVDTRWILTGHVARLRAWTREQWDRLAPAERPELFQYDGDHVVAFEYII